VSEKGYQLISSDYLDNIINIEISEQSVII